MGNPTEVAVGIVAKRRPSSHLGKANALGEETGARTLEAAGVGDQTCGERSAEITSGRSDSQPGLAATGKDRLTEGNRRQPEGFGLAHEPVGATKAG
jgi:hypothetical protein